MLSMLNCPYFEQKKCSSCQWIHMPYEQQLTEKHAHLTQQLNGLDLSQLEWLPPYTSQSQNFRNKAKMVVSGSVERPVLGILSNPNDPQSAVDLSHCLLYPKHFADMFTVLKTFIGRAGLVPYNIAKRKGELKYILLTESQINGTLMVRFVLRSTKKLSLIQRELPQLLEKLPQIKVVSLNIQPKHAAVLEGEEEIFLTKQKQLEENFNQIPLFIRPQGFFQTNPKVAEGLYRTAQQWVKDLPIQNIWDLFCGVGGFGLHCAKSLQKKNPNVVLTGIEISPSAITSAKCSAEKLGLHQVKFQPLDATNFALAQAEKPDLLIVNPPRRGIGKELAQFLNKLQPHFILYSSCNAQSMGQDLKALTHYQVQKIQLFDMFPHTAHYEVLVLFKLMNK